MGVRYEWMDDDQIIMLVCIESPWTWGEYLETSKNLKTLIDALDHPCATIVDATNYGSLPKDGNTIQVLLKIDRLLSENLFASAIVGAPPGVAPFLSMMMKIRPRVERLTIFTSTVEEARIQLREHYSRLNPRPPKSPL